MRKVVSNTTPILSFIKLNRIDILEKIYERILIPEAVFGEIQEGKNKYYIDISKEPWIEILKVENRKILEQLEKELDKGEAEAIALSLELPADLLLIDEKLGRRIAEEKGIKISGKIGILIKAKKQGIIKEVKPFIYELIEKGNYYEESFIKLILQHTGEM
ncbi:DUF3368 domain-containing protein [Sulfurihydrogenibium azorense]|uniref:DUF3368 domain-containing protein n=1 Tax=Sulfurihydrogenibium azorense TaxID=309806 RepID=UPI00240978D6|nr:DUF3368 domain-containing protein [Sulfurihydrogenibium azorense]MDM7273515.1 DUF3368 domain-containing protein [Sulfurihydrogenibium azorense]